MRPGYLILGLLIIFSSCNKDNIEFDTVYDPVVKYVIELEGLHINSYTKYVENELIETTTFYDYDSIIEKITKNASGETRYKIRYLMGQDNYAISSKDTSYKSNYISTSEITYEYDDDQIREYTEGCIINDTSIHYSMPYTVYYTFAGGNMVSISYSLAGTLEYRYNNIQNLIDLRFLSNNITGKISKNLIEYQDQYGFSMGHENSPPTSEYSYEINSNGFVTKTTVLCTPGYNSGGPNSPTTITRTIKTTVYEYIFR